VNSQNTPLTDQRLDEIQALLPTVFSNPWRVEHDPKGYAVVMDNALPVATISYNADELGPFIACAPDVVKELLAEVKRLRDLVNPASWTAPDGTVLDLSRQIFDRSGDTWQITTIPPLTVAMVDGDLDDRTLPELYAKYGPLTNDGEEI
jgi:hypothetical protein